MRGSGRRRAPLGQRWRGAASADDRGHRHARRAVAARRGAARSRRLAPRPYGKALAAAQARAQRNLLAAIPSAQIVYRYRIVADGFAIVVPTRDVARLTKIPGIAKVWPNLTYHALGVTRITVTRARRSPRARR